MRRTGRVAGRGEWGLFDVVYETAPEWLDEITFNYYVMTEDGDRRFNFFEVSVTYLDVARGRHNACAALPPHAVARYGVPTAFGVEIVVDGETVADAQQGSVEKWWTLVQDKPNIARRPGYLVDRSKTPFALANIDDYEAVR